MTFRVYVYDRCYQVEPHTGIIHIACQEGVGTTVVVRLPVSPITDVPASDAPEQAGQRIEPGTSAPPVAECRIQHKPHWCCWWAAGKNASKAWASPPSITVPMVPATPSSMKNHSSAVATTLYAITGDTIRMADGACNPAYPGTYRLSFFGPDSVACEVIADTCRRRRGGTHGLTLGRIKPR